MAKIDFIGQAYQARSISVEGQECINLFLEADPDGRNALYGTPGCKLNTTVGTGPIRGIFQPSYGADAIVVSGAGVYRLTKLGASTFIGSLSSSTGPVCMADNGLLTMLVDGTASGYLISPAYVFSVLSSSAFYGGTSVYFLDGRFILNRPGTGQFYASDMYKATFSPLNFATAESSPDNLLNLIIDHREVWLLGSKTIEIWANSGAAGFPYERLTGAAIDLGCAAKYSVARMDNSVFWLGTNEASGLMVYRAESYAPKRISTHAIEFAIANYETVSDAQAYCYQQEGHSFYVLTFPTANATWAFDAATGAWHQRAYMSDGLQTRHRSNCFSSAWGLALVGDYENGNIYALDMDTYTDNGAAILRSRSCKTLQDGDYEWINFASLQVDFEAGQGLNDGQGIAPLVALQYSDDGGFTWSNERTCTLGAQGKYANRARWTRMGRSRSRVFRVRISDPIPVVIIGAAVNGGYQ